MKWLTLRGKLIQWSANKYRIKWDRRCPSLGAQQVKLFLRKHFPLHVLYEEFRLPGSLLRVDFLDATTKVAVEYNGIQHNTYVKHFHKSPNGFKNSIYRDMEKLEILEHNGYKLLEIYEEDLPLTLAKFNEKLTQEV